MDERDGDERDGDERDGDERTYKVGELARRTGLTVRTLHYWDEIALLVPTRQTSSGHRLYGHDDLVRLQQIVSLRDLGFAVGEIGDLLDRPDFSPLRVVELHLERIEEQIALSTRLRARLTAIAERLRAAEVVSAETLIDTIEVTTMFEKHYTKEQLETLAARRRELGEERIEAAQNEWTELLAAVRAEMEAGTDPADPRVKALAARWQALVGEFTGGDPGIAASLRRMYDEEPDAGRRFGPDPALRDYVSRAVAAGSA